MPAVAARSQERRPLPGEGEGRRAPVRRKEESTKARRETTPAVLARSLPSETHDGA